MHLRICCFVSLVFALPAGAADAPGYPRPDLLVEPAVLAKPGVARKYVIVDARSKAAHLAGHIPDATWVDAKGWAKAFAAGRDRPDWTKRIGGLGIDGTLPVVVYDAGLATDGARVWWILRYWGVSDVRLLNGGWGGWVKAGGLVQKGAVAVAPLTPRLEAQPGRLATKADVLAAVKGKVGQVLDSRSEGEYCGTAKTAKRNGAVPGAVRLEWKDTLDPKTGRFKTAAELTKLFKAAGIDPTRPATTYCQSGGRASVLAFAVELMGGREVRNYYRSWAEWGNDPDTPIVRPKAKAP